MPLSEKQERSKTASQDCSLSGPLATLKRLKAKDGETFFELDHITAGERLAKDFLRGQMQPRLTQILRERIDLSAPSSSNGADTLSCGTLGAQERVRKALEALGPELSGIALDVCCFEKGLEAVERERQWPKRSAKLMLKTALSVLARHYNPPAPVQKTARIRAWRDTPANISAP